MINEQKFNEIFDVFLDKIGLEPPRVDVVANPPRVASEASFPSELRRHQTNPIIIKEIAQKEMYLMDFEPLKEDLEPLLKTSFSTTQMLTTIRKAIFDKHPALKEFIVEGVKSGLFDSMDCDRVVIDKIIHRMVLLQLVVRKMIESPQFTKDLRVHYHKMCKQLGMRTSFFYSVIDVFKATGDAFETAKVLTMDHVIAHYEKLREPNDFWKTQLKKRNKGLFANMFEATAADYVRGFKDNALAGFVLNMSLINKMEVVGENSAVKLHLDKGWMSLYEAWNLAFCFGKVGNADLLIGKLLIPEVIDANEEDYLFHRGLALWVAAHIVLFYRLNGGGKDPAVNAQMEELGRRLAVTNLPYVQEFSNQHHNTNPKEKILSRYLKKIKSTYM